MKRLVLLLLLALVPLAVLPAAASAQDGADAEGTTQSEEKPAGDDGKAEEEPQRHPARLKLRLRGNNGGSVEVGRQVRLAGTLGPLVKGERVNVRLLRNGKTIRRARVTPKRPKSRSKGPGAFSMRSPALIRPGKYRFVAVKRQSDNQKRARAQTRNLRVRYPNISPGQTSDAVLTFTRLLKRRGYHVPRTRSYNAAVERAVIALHKVMGRPRTPNATRRDFRDLARGKGGYRLRHKNAGKHVEVDVTRQVMVFANKRGKVRHIFHVSTGKPATPSDLGHYRFYRYEPGLNSLGMYYSVYYNRGEATHGYKSVPTYAASAGCIRNPMSNSIFIYRWINLGMSIYVYR